MGIDSLSSSGNSSVIEQFGIDPIEEILFSGNIHRQLKSAHRFHMYDMKELTGMLSKSKCEVVELSASGVISVQNDTTLEGKWMDNAFWDRFLSWEIKASKQPGLLESGTHIIVALNKGEE